MTGAAVAALMQLAGCTAHVRTPYRGADDVAVVAARETAPSPAFEYTRAEVHVTNHLAGVGATSRYRLRLLEFPSIGDNGQDGNLISARYFQSTATGPRPLVIVLPIWARFTYPSNKICSYLQRHSDGAVHVLDVLGVRFLIDWAELADAPDEETYMALWRRAVERERVTMIDIRRLVDWAAQRPEVDGSRVAIIGFSHSAILAGTVVTQEPRLAAVVLVMGGAHPEQIVAHCRGERTSSVQERAEDGFGWSRDELARRLQPVFEVVDAASYAGRVDPQKVLFFDARRDRCIPESSRDALWEALGRPERISLDYSHRNAFLSMTPLGGSWMCRRIWEFLEPRLADR